jgi:hypothetical protein
MLAAWLDRRGTAFEREYRGKAPFACVGAAVGVVERCWQALHRVLARASDVILAEHGRAVDQPTPRDEASLDAEDVIVVRSHR